MTQHKSTSQETWAKEWHGIVEMTLTLLGLSPALGAEEAREAIAAKLQETAPQAAALAPVHQFGFDDWWNPQVEEAEVAPSPEEEGFARAAWSAALSLGDYSQGYIDGREAGYHACGSCEHAWEAHDGECGAYEDDGSICGCPRRITTEAPQEPGGEHPLPELPDYIAKHRYSFGKDAEGFSTGSLVQSDFGQWVSSVAVHKLHREFRAAEAEVSTLRAQVEDLRKELEKEFDMTGYICPDCGSKQ